MINSMTEAPVPNEPTTAAAASPTEDQPSHWDGRWDRAHRHGRIYRLTAFVVMLAGIVFIIAVIFWSGFILGLSGHAGGHHGDEGSGSRHERGMVHYGLAIEQTVPSVAVTS